MEKKNIVRMVDTNAVRFNRAAADNLTIESDALDGIADALNARLQAKYKNIMSFSGMSGDVEQGQTIEMPRKSVLAEYAPAYATGVRFLNAAPEEQVPIYWDPAQVNVEIRGEYVATASYGMGYYSEKEVYPSLTFKVKAFGLTSLENWYANGAVLDNQVYTNDTTMEVLSEYEITNMTGALQGDTVVVSVPNLKLTSDVTSLENAFAGCTNLTTISGFNDKDSFADVTCAFKNCSKLTTLPGFTATANAQQAFFGCTSMVDLGHVTLDTTEVVQACAGCTKLTTPPVLTARITDYTSAFANSTSLTSLTLPETAANYTTAFSGCTGLTSAPAFNAVNATEAFKGCTGMTTASNVRCTAGDAKHVFQNCTKLATVDNITLTNTDATSAFSGCSALVTVDTLTCTGANFTSAFTGCTKLATVIGLACSNANLTDAFKDRTSLTSVNFTASVGANLTEAFSGCTALTTVTGTLQASDLTKAFYGCTALPELFSLVIDITNGSVVTDMFAGSSVTTVKMYSAYGVPQTMFPEMLGVQAIIVVDENGEELRRIDVDNHVRAVNWLYDIGGEYTALIPGFVSAAQVSAVTGFTAVGDDGRGERYPLAQLHTSSFGPLLTSNPEPTVYSECSAAAYEYGRWGSPPGYTTLFHAVHNYKQPGYANSDLRASSLSAYYHYVTSQVSRNCYGFLQVGPSMVSGRVAVTPGSKLKAVVGEGGVVNKINTLSFMNSGAKCDGFVYAHWDDQVETNTVPRPTGDDVVTCLNNSYRMSDLFSNYATMTTLPKRLNTAQLGVGYYMFSGCAALTAIDTSEMYFGCVQNMDHMFSDCAALANIDLAPLQRAVPTNMQYMFANCAALTEVDLEMNTAMANGSYMFSGCTGLTKVKLGMQMSSSWTNVFTGCTALQEIDLSGCVRMCKHANAFENLTALTTVKLPSGTTRLDANAASMFAGCTSLTTIDGVLDFKDCTTYTDMFKDCAAVAGVKIKNPPADITAESGFAGLAAGQYEIIA